MRDSSSWTTHLQQKSRTTLFNRDLDADEVPKTTVIAIAATATVLVLAILAGCLFLSIRRHKQKAKGKVHGRALSEDSIAGDHDLYSSQSKTPLMQEEESSQTNQYHSARESKSDEESDIAVAAPNNLHRLPSTGTIRSLPPSYLAATHGAAQSAARTPSPSPHRPGSSFNGSDGLRPLVLVNAQQTHGEYGQNEGRDRHEFAAQLDTTLLAAQRTMGRPRAGSRFVEEDLDV